MNVQYKADIAGARLVLTVPRDVALDDMLAILRDVDRRIAFANEQTGANISIVGPFTVGCSDCGIGVQVRREYLTDDMERLREHVCPLP